MSTMQTAMKMALIRRMKPIPGRSLRPSTGGAAIRAARTPMSMTPRVRATSNTCYGSGNSPVIRRNLQRFWNLSRCRRPAACPFWPGSPPVRGGPLPPSWACMPRSGPRCRALLYPNLPLDLIEALIYGREWQLGYDKLPPLPWWLVEIAYRLVGHDFAYYLLAQVAVVAALARRLAGGAAARRPARRAGGRAHRRRPALPQLHLRQVQPRRHPAAVLGAGRLRLPARAARPADARTGCCSDWRSGCRCGRNISSPCWRSPWRCSCSSTATRARRLATPGPYIAIGRRADHHGAASGLAGAERFPALRLCRAPRAAVARTDRSRLAPAAIRGQPVVLPDAVAADRGCRCSIRARAPAKPPASVERRRLRPPHRHAARLRTDGDGAGALGVKRPRHRGHVGLSALAVPRPVDRAERAPRARRAAAWPRARSSGRSCSPAWRSPSSPITRCCRITITATARCSSPAAISAAKSRNAIAPSPENRSSM